MRALRLWREEAGEVSLGSVGNLLAQLERDRDLNRRGTKKTETRPCV